MRFSNFRDHIVHGHMEFATVDQTSGFWMFKKTKPVKVFKNPMYWRYVETGRFIDGLEIDYLEAAYRAKKAMQ